MGRWTQYDEDAYRLPEGMKRTGYDADTGRYYFQGGDRSIWQGAQGAEFSEMTRVSGPPPAAIQERDGEGDVEASPRRPDGYQSLPDGPSRTLPSQAGTYRTLFPFFLIIATVLLLAWRLVISPVLSTPPDICPNNTSAYWVKPGDACWDISQKYGCTLEELKSLNLQVDCAALMPGMTMCLPQTKSTP